MGCNIKDVLRCDEIFSYFQAKAWMELIDLHSLKYDVSISWVLLLKFCTEKKERAQSWEDWTSW